MKNQSIVEKEKTIASQNRELMALKHQDKETESYIYDLKKQLNDQVIFFNIVLLFFRTLSIKYLLFFIFKLNKILLN